MNRLILFLFICTGIIGCVSPKKPIFKTIKSIKIEKIGLREVTLNADAIFENPNALQGTLSLEDLHIFVNDLDVGTISSTTFEVPSKAEFNVPLKGSFSLSKIYKKQQKATKRIIKQYSYCYSNRFYSSTL
ncbi:hypothetical protein [Aquimarina rhabdastrellae]